MTDKFPSYCCQKCGEQIGYVGRFLSLLHKCKQKALDRCYGYLLLALKFYRDSGAKEDIVLQIEDSKIYVKAGKTAAFGKALKK